ncbi:LuxR C-terminal-related transcriptional regulator [Gordonia sp. NPDC003376]
MIIEAGCVGRDREIAEILDRAARSGGAVPAVVAPLVAAPLVAAPLVVVGAPGIGKSTLLRRLVSRADEVAVPIRVIDDADTLAPGALEARALDDATVFTVLAVTHQTPAIESLLGDVLRLGGLDRDAVAELATLRGRVVHPAVITRLTRHTRGNPRDIIALLDEVPPHQWSRSEITLPAPRRVVEEVASTLGGCPGPARALIEAITVVDDPESFSLAVELAGVDDLLRALDDARASGLVVTPATLTPADLQPRPADALVRAAVLEVMGIARVGEMHRRTAELADDRIVRLRHLVAATPTPDTELADQLDRLAHDSGGDGAWAQAAELFSQAGRLTADPLLREQRIIRALDARLAAGDCVGAAALVPAVESLRETAMRNVTLAYLAILRGRSTEAHVRLDRAWAIVNRDREPEVAAVIAQRYVLHHLVRCQGAELVTWAERSIAMAGDSSPAGIEAASIRGLGQAWSGRPDLAFASYDELAERVRAGAQAQRVTMGRGWLQLGTGDVTAARSSLESAVAMAALGGSNRISLWSMAWLARVHFLTGEWDQALQVTDQGRRLAHDSGIDLTTPLLNYTATQIHSLRGDWDAAESDVAEAAGPIGDYEIMRVPTLLARAQLAEAHADYGKVIRTLEPVRQLAQTTPALVEPGWWTWVDVLANALVIDGQLEAADALLTPHEVLAEQRGHRPARARLAYARGRLLGTEGDIHAAQRSFIAALEFLDGSPLRHDLARVNFAYGQTLRRAGKRRAADAVMSTAREIYLSLGATTYVERCDREIKAGGLHTARADRDIVDLTPQEDAVATLVAQGMSNREVAAQLYISPKTVQYHLTRIYAKLGVRSRAELAASRR